MKLSKFSLFLGTYIIISASFIQQVWFTWKAIFGINTVTLSFILLCLWIISALLYENIKAGINFKKIALIFAVYVFGFVFAWRQPYMAEKAHILEYGVLAWISVRDLSKDSRNIVKGVLYASIFVLVIGSLDEGFQKLLPWRVFEVRDIATNVISGILGIILFCITKK